MKIASFELERFLKEIKPAYLISGDEVLLVEEARQKIVQQLKKMDYAVNTIFGDSQDECERLLATQTNYSLFSEKTLIDLRINQGDLNAKFKTAIEFYLENPDSDKVLILTLSKLKAGVASQSWYKNLEKTGLVVNVPDMTEKMFKYWLEDALKQRKLNLLSEAKETLSRLTENNLLATQQALMQLEILPLTKAIDANTIKNLFHSQAKFDVFDLLDPMLNGDEKRSYQIFMQLRQEEVAPNLILWALVKDLQLLKNLFLSENKVQAFAEWRVWPKRQPAFQTALRRISYPLIERCFSLAAQIDKMIKTGSNDKTWMYLLNFVLALAGKEKILDFCQR